MTAKADLHVHSKASNRPPEWILRQFGAPESFTEPREVRHSWERLLERLFQAPAGGATVGAVGVAVDAGGTVRLPSALAVGAGAARSGGVPGLGLGAAGASEMRSTIGGWHDRQS
jgi:hypothetical protein